MGLFCCVFGTLGFLIPGVTKLVGDMPRDAGDHQMQTCLELRPTQKKAELRDREVSRGGEKSKTRF